MPKHSETRVLPYSAQQIYDLVADVARYPEFLPWCAAARVRSCAPVGEALVMKADMVISFKVFRERFTSRVTQWPAKMEIEIDYLDGPFRYLHSNWLISDIEGGCEVRFAVDFEFRNLVLQKIIGLVFNDAMARVVRAFEARAAQLYS
ncbi:MAG: type II toxin-antitoxin system RatA family toxin [Paracoccaceae bacterium]